MTYSIVARDGSTGQFGIGIQSHFFCVGDGPPWARASVGAVCTQAFTQVAYGPAGLDLLESGRTAEETVALLVEEDAGRDRRQVGVVDRDGGAFAFTGQKCIGHAGHAQADGVTAQANMVASSEIWTAMIAAYEAASGELADRLMAALHAAEAEGGDSRGSQSAALLVVGDGGETVDLRVDDHPAPLNELGRLLEYKRAYQRIGTALSEALTDSAATDSALRRLREAATTLGENPEAIFWEAIVLARAGRIDEARERLARCAADHAGWIDLVRRLPAAELLSSETAERLTQEQT
jgi:uncharacterized Ntn-hydrolase superfamily protein